MQSVFDERTAMYYGMSGITYDPAVHKVIDNHPIAEAMRRELDDPRWFVYWHAKTQNYVLGVWLDGPRLGEDKAGFIFEQTSWPAGGAPRKTVDEMVRSFHQGAGYRQRMRETQRKAQLNAIQASRSKAAEAREIGRHISRKLQTLGYEGTYDKRFLESGIGMEPADNPERRRELVEMGKHLVTILRSRK
jgi:hypothetical protein